MILLIFNSLQSQHPVTQDCINKLFMIFICLNLVLRTYLKFINMTTDKACQKSHENYLRKVDCEIEGFSAHGEGCKTIAYTVNYKL